MLCTCQKTSLRSFSAHFECIAYLVGWQHLMTHKWDHFDFELVRYLIVVADLGFDLSLTIHKLAGCIVTYSVKRDREKSTKRKTKKGILSVTSEQFKIIMSGHKLSSKF